MPRTLFSFVLVGLVLFFSSTSPAQSAGVHLENAGLFIPLQQGQIGALTHTGALNLQCAQTSSGSCEGLPGGTGVLASLELSVSSAGIGVPVTVTWEASEGAEICLAYSPAFIEGWSGSVSPLGGSTVITATSEGTAILSLKCFGVLGSDGTDMASLTIGAGGPGDTCQVTKESLRGPNGEETQNYRLFQPSGFTRVERPWTHVFPNKIYPDTEEYPYPVGSWSLTSTALSGPARYQQSPSMTGKYLTIPFTALNQSVGFQWITALPRTTIGYAPIRTAGNILVTITDCPGDFRTKGQFEPPPPPHDPTFVSVCRIVAHSEAGIAYGPGAQCRIIPGQRYYINIIFQDPYDGHLLPSRTTCSNQATGVCEASFVRN